MACSTILSLLVAPVSLPVLRRFLVCTSTTWLLVAGACVDLAAEQHSLEWPQHVLHNVVLVRLTPPLKSWVQKAFTSIITWLPVRSPSNKCIRVGAVTASVGFEADTKYGRRRRDTDRPINYDSDAYHQHCTREKFHYARWKTIVLLGLLTFK